MQPPRGERELIRRLGALLAEPSPPARTAVPFGDDMAALDGNLLWTVDMLMDGTDFDSRSHDWTTIGRKAMAVNLSDCAAMAALPVAALCAVSLRDGLTMQDALALHRGALDCGREFGCPIVGGDTNSWAWPTVIAITIAARVPPGRAPVLRGGARPGDALWLSGPVGGSILGRHLTFTPRVELAQRINAAARPCAALDISDGLALDLARMLEASSAAAGTPCGALLDAALLDAATHADAHALATRDGRSARDHALYDGEDFELLLAMPPAAQPVCAALGLLPIGEVSAQPGVRLRDGATTTDVPIRGWEHFT